MSEVLSLGGRFYAPAQTTTFAQDNYLRAIMLSSGMAASINGGGDLLDAVLSCEQLPELLGGFLVPIDEPWSKANAVQSAAVFAGLTDPAEKQALMDMVTVLLTGFLGAAGSLNPSSLSASPASETPPESSPPRRQRRTPVEAGTGAPSSLPSPTTSGPPPVS